MGKEKGELAMRQKMYSNTSSKLAGVLAQSHQLGGKVLLLLLAVLMKQHVVPLIFFPDIVKPSSVQRNAKGCSTLGSPTG